MRPAKRRRGLTSESPSTSLGSVVTANLGGTDTFEGHSNTVYRNWHRIPKLASFINAKVADHENGVWTTGIVQCLHQGILPSRTRTLPADSILPNTSHPFSIVWADDTDSICDLPLLLTYLDNHASKRHRADATRSPATGGRARRASNGAAAPSSLPSSSPLPHHPLPPSNASASTAGIFAGIHSRPGDLVDLLTRSGSFAFLSDLFDTERLFELPDFGARARPAQDGLDGASQQEAAPLFLPQLNQLHERGEDDSNVVTIPTQYRVSHTPDPQQVVVV